MTPGKPSIDWAVFSRHQFWALVAVSFAFLLAAPTEWRYSPDAGVYIGTAREIAENGRYWFNGYPNLLYYPGLSAVISGVIAIYGVDFQSIHLLHAGIVVGLLWLIRSYFSVERYGYTGLILPFLVASVDIVQTQAFRVLSDGLFLASVMGVLLLWRRYEEKLDLLSLAGALLLAAMSALVRFQGLLTIGAIGIALLIFSYQTNRLNIRRFFLICLAMALTLAPFAAWTIRNLILYSPDTPNVADSFFFGLPGLVMDIPGWQDTSWVDADWKYMPLRILLAVSNLTASAFSAELVRLAPQEISFLVVVLLVALGGFCWFYRATLAERCYVFISGLFLVYWMSRGRDLYFPTRYWLPVLPFLMAASAMAFGAVSRRRRLSRISPLFSSLGVMLLIVCLANGVSNFKFETSQKRAAYWRDGNAALHQLAEFVERRIPPNAPVSTLEWGIIPLAINRVSYPTVTPRFGDTVNLPSLERIARRRTEYLVWGGYNGRRWKPTLNMVRRFPDVFEPVFESGPRGEPTLRAHVYRVDLERLNTILKEFKNQRPPPNRR